MVPYEKAVLLHTNAEKKGWVERNRSKEDERVLNVTITAAGEALKEKAVYVPEQMAECVKLDSAEAMQLYKTLHKILEQLDKAHVLFLLVMML